MLLFILWLKLWASNSLYQLDSYLQYFHCSLCILLPFQNKCTQPEDVKLCTLILRPATAAPQRKKVVSFLRKLTQGATSMAFLFFIFHLLPLQWCSFFLSSLLLSLFVRPWWRKQSFTHLKLSQVSSCHGLSRVLLLPLLLRPPHIQDRLRSPCPSQLALLQYLLQLWRNQPCCLAPPPSRMAWGDVRDGGSTAEAEINGGSQRRGWEGGCHSRRSGRRHRCSPLCLVSRSAD